MDTSGSFRLEGVEPRRGVLPFLDDEPVGNPSFRATSTTVTSSSICYVWWVEQTLGGRGPRLDFPIRLFRPGGQCTPQFTFTSFCWDPRRPFTSPFFQVRYLRQLLLRSPTGAFLLSLSSPGFCPHLQMLSGRWLLRSSMAGGAGVSPTSASGILLTTITSRVSRRPQGHRRSSSFCRISNQPPSSWERLRCCRQVLDFLSSRLP
jgi:hypothetical protein